MAISIISNFTSNKFYPSANPINTTVNSNNSGKCNFRYICDLYINGTKVYTDKIFPDPTTGYGFFLLSRVLQDYIATTVVSNTSSSFSLAANTTLPAAAFSVYCKFGEEYDNSTNCDGQVLQYPNLTTSNTFYVYEGAFDYEDYPTYDYTQYMMGTASATASKLFLTNSPREVDITYNDSYYLDFLTLQPMTSAFKMVIEATDYLTGSIATFSVSSPSLSYVKRYRMNVGPLNLSKMYGIPLISQDCRSYKVWLSYNNVRQSEIFTFNVKDPKEFTTRIGFVGLLGGIEHFTFYHRNLKGFTIDRKTYERTIGSNNSGTWKYNVGDRGTTTYKVTANEVHKVASFCSKETSEWLYEMWLSPDVWTYRRPELQEIRIYAENGHYVPAFNDRILFWVNDTSDLAVGDTILVVPEPVAGYSEFTGSFTIQSINGNVVDVGADWSSYFPPRELCAYIFKNKNFDRLPVVISDNNIEVKPKLARPIEYTLTYQMAYTKNTIRG